MRLIDTHCHLTFEGLQTQLSDVLERSLEANVNQWICVGTDGEHSQMALVLARQHQGMYATVGVHPHEATLWDEALRNQITEMASDELVVAMGETGLDYHYDFSPRDKQRSVFDDHLVIAAKHGLPVVIHSREAFEDTVDILTCRLSQLDKVVFHCFTGTVDEAKTLVDLGCYLSFTGVVTFKNANSIREAVKVVPLERLMVETDCPYMSPVPMRKQRTNEPALLVHTARCLADIKGLSYEEFCKVTVSTSEQFFGLNFQTT